MKFSKLASVGAAVSSLALSGVAFAQQAATPTTATALAQAVDMSDAKTAGLVVTGLLIAVGVTLWGARLVGAKFRPKA